MKNKIYAALLVLPILFFALPVYAADFMAPSKDSANQGVVILGTTEKKHNLYTAGASVTLNGEVSGDLFAAGATVSMDGNVEKDVNIAGANVTLAGNVGDDLRAAGANLNISSKIGGDILAAGSNLTLTDKSTIGGDAVLAGANLTLNAPVKGSLKIAGENIVINSEVTGPVTVQSQTAVTFGPKAKIDGKVIVYGSKNPIIKEGAQVNTPELKPLPVNKNRDNGKGLAGLLGGWYLTQFLALFVFAYLISWLFPSKLMRHMHTLKSKFMSSLGYGLVFAIIIPIAALLLLITVVGYQLAIVGFLGYALLMFIASPVAAVWLGSWIMMKLGKKTEMLINWQAILVGCLIMQLITLIPLIGWLVCAIITLAAFGSLLMDVRSTIEKTPGIDQ